MTTRDVATFAAVATLLVGVAVAHATTDPIAHWVFATAVALGLPLAAFGTGLPALPAIRRVVADWGLLLFVFTMWAPESWVRFGYLAGLLSLSTTIAWQRHAPPDFGDAEIPQRDLWGFLFANLPLFAFAAVYIAAVVRPFVPDWPPPLEWLVFSAAMLATFATRWILEALGRLPYAYNTTGPRRAALIIAIIAAHTWVALVALSPWDIHAIAPGLALPFLIGFLAVRDRT